MDVILQKIQTQYSLSDKDIRYLKFTITGLFYDISKMLLLFLFFWAIDEAVAFCFDLTLLILLRGNQGGLHTKHYFTCFLMSFGFLAFAICLMPMFPIPPKPIILTILTLCILINYFIGPIRSEQCHVKDTGIFKKNQINTFFVVFAFCILYYILPSSHLMNTGFWIIVAQSVQLMIAKYIQYQKRKGATV